MTWTTGTSDLWIWIYVVVIVVMDIALALADVRLTWSQRLKHWSRRAPILPFALGVLMGHFLGPDLHNPWWTPLVLVGLSIGLIAADVIADRHTKHEYDFTQRLVIHVTGWALGALLWAQA
jgi:hypothetical protein